VSYTIVKTNGTILTTITDGTINTVSTSIGLPGRLYPGYGQVVDTNFVHTLENFANTAPPSNALQGQLWYDTSTATLCVCPIDGESNPNNWYKIKFQDPTGNSYSGNVIATGNVIANNAQITSNITANLANVNYLKVNIQANIANANVTGQSNLAQINTTQISAGATGTNGNLTGAWTLTGSNTLNGVTGTALWVTGGNLLASGIKTNNWYYANGSPVVFGTVYSNSNVASYLPTYTGDFGLLGGGANINGDVLSTGSATTAGTITGNWTLSPSSKINGVAVDGANVSGTVANATQANLIAVSTQSTSPTTYYPTLALGASSSATIAIDTGLSFVPSTNFLTVLGNVSANQFISTVTNGTAPLVVSSTTKVANLNADLLDGATATTTATASTVALRDTNGDITANYFIGDGSQLTNLPTTTTNTIANGTSNIRIPGINSNVTISVGSTTNVAVFTTTGITTSNISAGNLSGNITTATQSNITTVGTLTSVNSSGNVTAPNVVANTGAFYGNGAGLTNISGANVNGVVSNANAATYSSIVLGSSQTNITSLGTLSSLNVSGKVTAGQLQGEGGNLSNIRASNVVGTVSSATTATSATNATTASNIAVTSKSANASAFYPIFVSGVSSSTDLGLDSSLSYVPSTNTLSVGTVNANFVGSGTGLTSVPGSNVVGAVASATSATNAGTASVANSVAGANVTGKVANAVYADNSGTASVANSVAGANVVGAVANATFATNAGTAATATLAGTASVANSVAGANVVGAVASATFATSSGTATSATTAGTVTSAAQPNITSVGSTLSIGGQPALTAGSFAGVNGTNGYATLPNGLKMVWGVGSSTVGQDSSIYVPFTYPFGTDCYNVQVTPLALSTNNSGGGENSVYGITKNGFTYYHGQDTTVYPMYFAIGI